LIGDWGTSAAYQKERLYETDHGLCKNR
jgi:hypothetical protein